jgi:hypothetical protein
MRSQVFNYCYSKIYNCIKDKNRQINFNINDFQIIYQYFQEAKLSSL